MAQVVNIWGVLSHKSVVVKDKKTGIGERKTIWELKTGNGDMSCWDDPAVWNPTGVWPVKVAGTVTNKPYQGQNQFTLKGITVMPAAKPVVSVPSVPVPPTTAGSTPTFTQTTAPSAVKSAFERMADKDRVVARESVLKSVAEMIEKIAKPLDKENLPRGWQAGDIIALCRTLEDLYIYRAEDAK